MVISGPSVARSWGSKTFRVFGLISVCAVAAIKARAHDAFEIWTIALLRADRLDLTITMAKSTAIRLIDPQSKNTPITCENFSTYRTRLEEEGSSLCLPRKPGKKLSPPRVEVELTDENGVVFRLYFPCPTPGALQFHAACLKKLDDGYGGFLDASDHTGAHLGWEQLSFDHPTFEVTIPAALQKTK